MSVEATITVEVLGLIVSFPGRNESVALTHGVTGELERWRIATDFGVPEGTLPVTTVRTEADLASHLRTLPGSRLTVGRFRLPRIRDLYRQIYWPPSQRVGDLLRERASFLIQDPSAQLPGLEFDEMEGLDMRAIWEPIWSIHPAAQSFPDLSAPERCYRPPWPMPKKP
ncbi:MAG: hypothetical protein H0T75_23055 [Rhizobiales bacterium]|nr:hypothetical protein [Hyphomicrobiales bacterium]